MSLSSPGPPFLHIRCHEVRTMGTRVFPGLSSGLPVAILLSAVLWAPVTAQDVSPAQIASVDSIFQRFDGTMTPGCAVGVSDDHAIILERAYGMADLEHGVINTARTVSGIEGWPRTTRVHTHTHVLDIASRQMSLNYPPGE